MRLALLLGLGLAFLATAGPAAAQPKKKKSDDDFVREKPLVGDPLPDLTVYSPDGKEFRTADLRGHYTVLTFGCLTWPPFLWNVSGLEAAYRDFAPKGVKFFFIYKTLAHPELVGGYVQPVTLGERLAHARQAQKQLGGTVPWIVDAMDNRLKHALGDRPNSEFIIDPQGKIVRKRAWSFPAQVRKDLEELAGKPDRVTRDDEVKLNVAPPLKAPAARGVVPRITRPRMQAVAMEPQVEKGGQPFYAKLRAEADADLLNDGKGKLYLGFHLDPFHGAHWNNLTEPLRYKVEPSAVKIDRPAGAAPKAKAASDADPREFLLEVEDWPEGEPLKVTVTYAACVGETACHAVKQSYVLRRQRDADGGGARGDGAGFWDADEFARQALAGDRDADGKLSRKEVRGLVLPHFDRLDVNKDGLLDAGEIKEVADWLNRHHAPGVPARPKQPAADRWEKDIRAFEEADRKSPPPKGAVLFIGSSTVKLWKTLAGDFPDHTVINRGFGGSQIADATRYAGRIVLPYEPRLVVLRAGGNDINAGKSPEQVFADFKAFVAAVHAKLPETEVVFIGLSPTIARWKQTEQNRELNALVEAYARRTPKVRYVDAYAISLGADGKPRPELFVMDGLHFSAEGYKLLAERVRRDLPK